MYYLEAGYGKHNRLRNAVLLAIALHLAVLLGISFKPGGDPAYAPQVEVTLASFSNTTAPEDASHIAQANQEGSGEQASLDEITSPQAAVASDNQAAALAPLQPETSPDTPRTELVTTAAAAERAVDSGDSVPSPQPLQGVSPEVDQLTRELASLQAELDEQSRNYARMPRVRRLTSVATRQAADAAYLLEWRKRVEAVGNRYYPEASVRYGLYGSLRLLVTIRSDGSLADIRVLSSSGYAVLDEAAIKIVRMAAPYSPFPEELRATTDQLEIIRTWQFQENRLSSQ
jgi:protein TonB